MRFNSFLTKKHLFCSYPVLLFLSLFCKAGNSISDQDFLDQFIMSKGYHGTIVFNASNIKQYWTDKSVLSKDNSINIVLSSKDETITKESVPLKIQLKNVDETQNCRIDVITNTPSASFSVINNSSKPVSNSFPEPQFINYYIFSSVFHLEDTLDNSFYLKFSSREPIISIQKIVISFSNNSRFLASTGNLKISKNNAIVLHGEIDRNDSFSVTGKQTRILSKNSIIVSNSLLKSSVSIKNIGKTPTRIYVGYATFAKGKVLLDGKNYPYDNSLISLNVISSAEGSKKIIVDHFPIWRKDCYLALNVEEDHSDIPNKTFASGRIAEVNQLPDNQAEIIMSESLSSPIAKGTKVRVNGLQGAYLYTNTKVLQPGEEALFEHTIRKDDTFLQYSSKAFSKGVYYVTPLILSYSVDQNKDNTISIKDFSISY